MKQDLYFHFTNRKTETPQDQVTHPKPQNYCQSQGQGQAVRCRAHAGNPEGMLLGREGSVSQGGGLIQLGDGDQQDCP